MSTILIFLRVIIFLVVAHELGHFLVAKLFKVRVDEFGVGYPPRAKKLFTWKGTLFTLNWLPFGGFVKVFGEDEGSEPVDPDVARRSGSFAYQTLWKRVAIVAAGIVANMLIAVILYSMSFGIGFLAEPGDFPGSVAIGPNQTIVTDVVASDPASKAGIESGDVIRELSAAGATNIPTTVNDVVDFVHAHGATPITISVERSGHEKNIVVTPKITPDAPPAIGISLATVARVRLPFFVAIKTGFSYTWQEFVSTIVMLGALLGGLFHGSGALLGDVSGPVGIAKIAGQAFSLGFGAFLSFVALISVNLAVINLLPFPALDGGRIVLELFAAKGYSRIPKRVVNAVNNIGFLLLILLMLVVTYHDIHRLFT